MEISVPLPQGDDKLMLLSMVGTESLGRLFHFEIDLMAEEPVKSADALGKNVTIRLKMREGNVRFFNGYVSRFMFVSIDEANKDHSRLYYYRATVVPRLWFLTRHADCRIFQNMSVPDIIRKIFAERSISDFEVQLNGTYDPWVYCVQYRETDFNFISRLMEHEGIYYYFKHENGKHTVVLCDHPTAHKAAPGYDNLEADKPDLKSTNDAYIWNWTQGTEITPNKYALTDYNPLQPKTDLAASVKIDHAHDPDAYEIFDYPGDYENPEEGPRYANTRLEEIEAQYEIGHGTTSARGVFAGSTFTLTSHPAYDEAVEFLVTSASYRLENDDIGGGAGRSGGSVAYQAEVTCIPSKYEFRSPRITPRPVVQGPQTAVVVGPAGDEIHTNDQGQVKVKFFWDRDPKKDENSSCWVRVSQPWAGLSWGAINLPRIGQEVIIEFIEGDPDRPIITGRVYNGVNVPPNALPGSQTMTTFKTNSSKGGGGFNELTFEDKKGSELIFIHGEKDMHVRIKNDRVETVMNDQHLTIQNVSYTNISANASETIGGNLYESLGGDHHEDIGGQEAKHVAGAFSLKVDGNVAEEFGGDHSETTGGKISLKAASLIVECDKITLKCGGTSIAMDSSSMNIKVDGKLTISSSGQTSISADGGLTETGSKVSITADTTCSVQGSSVTVKADGKISLKASGIMEAQGSMIKLN